MKPLRCFKMEKLVRDKIPEMLTTKGGHIHIQALSSDTFLSHLSLKLKEETDELLAATTLEDIQEEIADVLEVLHALTKFHGVSMTEIEKKRLRKQKERGGFEKRIFIKSIEIEESTESQSLLHYYRSRPQDYPEII